MKEHAKKFCWIPVGWFEEQPWDKTYFFNELENLKKIPESFEEKLRKLENSSNSLSVRG